MCAFVVLDLVSSLLHQEF